MTVARIGADGDGIAALSDGTPLYIPLTLPGETVRARPVGRHGGGWRAETESIAEPAADRIAPPCPHFGPCGGCTLQHWQDDAYAAWKTGLLRAALARAGYPDAPVGPLQRSPPASRRRADLAVRRTAAGVVLGLHRRGSGEIVNVVECAVLHPALTALLLPLHRQLPRLAGLRREGSVVVNLLDSGPDLLLRTDAALTTADRTALVGFAAAHGIPRLAWAQGNGAPEPICVLRPPTTMFGETTVTPPPGAFLQATAEGEAAIVAAILAGLPERLPAKARIVELYAGCGTLSFALAARARVLAYEGDGPSAAALRAATGGRRVSAMQRDLSRQPLTQAELAGAAAVVLDPPHAGAAAQMPFLAASGVARIVHVSCNPATLARDARVLRDAGYRLLAATPIDQFRWSARLESVTVFAR